MTVTSPGSALRTLIVGVFIAAGALTVLPAAAQAGLGAKNSIELLPKTVRVGDSGTATLNLVNDDLAPDTGATNTICNFGDLCPSVTDPDGILVVPSCHALAVGTVCNAGDEDPGVFAFSSTGTGALGSSCAGMVFDIARVPSVPDVGAYRFTPQGGAHVTLAGADAFCNVNFAYAVRRAPRDADPGTAGLQTITYAAHSEISPAQPLSNAHARGATINSTVLLAQPTIATTASGNATLGTALSDHAIVSGLVAPAAGATITFLLYGPDNAACSGTPLFTSTQTAAIAGSTATATSSAFAPTAAGTYRWTAAYSGDANNLPVAGACGDSGETQTVTVACTPAPATPPPGGSVCATVPPPGCTPPPGPAPQGGTLCPRGSATITGKSGCRGKSFAVVVKGRQIAGVVFSVDNKVVRRLSAPNSSASRYRMPINIRAYRIGVHRVVARTTFLAASGTRTRVLRVTFQRCAKKQEHRAAFTG